MDSLLQHAQAYKDTKNAQTGFVEECKDLEEKVKEDEESAKSQLSIFLEDHPSAKMSNGKYLTLKTSVSKKKLNEDRVREGVLAVQRSDIKSLQEGNPDASVTECIAGAIEDNIRNVCSTTTQTPRIVSGAPKDLPKGIFTVTAPVEVEKLCSQLKETQDKLKTIREHKKTGKNQCAPTLDVQQDAVSCVLENITSTTDSAVEIRMIPAPSLEMDGDDVSLPTLPMGDNTPVLVEKKGNKKRKAAVYEAVIQGLEQPIKIKRKQKKAPKGKVANVEVEDLTYELGQRLAEQNVTVSKFFKDQGLYSEQAVALLAELTPDVPEPEMLSEFDVSIN
jgi:hypothetical protein